jgi:protein-disulfide isomerase
VTIVEFSDLECPFCARAEPELAELERRYGPEKVRVVWKNDPLPFHRHAQGAARAARTVFELAGPDAFFGYVGALFADQGHLEPEQLSRTAAAFGVAPAAFDARVASPAVAARVAADVALAGRLGVDGTPHFLINGLHVSGAVPADELATYVDKELVEAAALAAQGVKPPDVYATRTVANYREPSPDTDSDAPDTTVWNVPLGTSPREGPDDALVTMVVFTDLQCPFCKRADATMTLLRQQYGKDLRVVFKHLPLPFHDRARPSATLAIEARRKFGDAGFFHAVKLIYAAAPNLGDDQLAAIAKELHLEWAKVKDVILRDADAPIIDADLATGRDFAANGTPHFFINGKRLVGAQPLEAFTSLIDAELDSARTLMRDHGVAARDVFDVIMKSGKASTRNP